jgi:homoserine dehydrogenase
MGESQTRLSRPILWLDRPALLAVINRMPADRDISIDAMIQKDPPEGQDRTDIILLTHVTMEKNAVAAISAIEALSTVSGSVVRIRLEALN